MKRYEYLSRLNVQIQHLSTIRFNKKINFACVRREGGGVGQFLHLFVIIFLKWEGHFSYPLLVYTRCPPPQDRCFRPPFQMMRVRMIMNWGVRRGRPFHFSDRYQHMDMFKQIRRKEMWHMHTSNSPLNNLHRGTSEFKDRTRQGRHTERFDLPLIKEIDKLQCWIQNKALKAQYSGSPLLNW